MNFSRDMIDLVFQIRRQLPSEERKQIKLTNPDLFAILTSLYQLSAESSVKENIRQLFDIAQQQGHLEGSDPGNLNYRGAQVQDAEDAPQAVDVNKKKTLRVYRGQVVHA